MNSLRLYGIFDESENPPLHAEKIGEVWATSPEEALQKAELRLTDKGLVAVELQP